MIIIADSGSSKTDWRFIDDQGNVSQDRSDGVNPNYMTEEQILEVVSAPLSNYKSETVELYFYGSGCKAQKNVALIIGVFDKVLHSAHTHVNHDLLGAARSLCGDQKGVACILGTGSNSCLYDGASIVDNVRSLGYLLGDEGSGTYIGKTLLQRYLRGKLSDQVTRNFEKRFGDDPDELIRTLYQDESPVKFMSRFSKFVYQNIKDPNLYRMVYDIMISFLESNVQQYEGYSSVPVHFTGSVAYYFGNILRKAGQDKAINIQHISESPIAGLTLYHKS